MATACGPTGPVGLGHRRLAIIDLSPAGRQPMTIVRRRAHDHVQRRDLQLPRAAPRARERGHRFRSRTDTEVMLAAYREWGVDCLERASAGMFAFALWDAPARTLFIARDRVGKKPLHYLVDRDGIAFASEPKAFLADPAFQPRAGPRGAVGVPELPVRAEPAVGLQGRAASCRRRTTCSSRDGRVTVERYWKLSYAGKRRITEARGVRGAARAAARGGAAAADQRRAARRVPERRRRLERRRRADGRA